MKRIITIVLSIVLSFSATHIVFADESTIDGISANNSIPEELLGLDIYMSISTNGTIIFDKEAALLDNYTLEGINFVDSNIRMMNAIFSSRNLYSIYIDQNFNLVIVLPCLRANGESKIVSTWYGVTQIYLNSDEAAALYDNVSAFGSGVTIGGALGFLPQPYGTFLGILLYGMGVGTVIYGWQIKQAIDAGDGSIIMNIYIDPVTSVESVWFTAQ